MLFLPKDEAKLLRWFAFVVSLIPFALSVYLWIQFKPDAVGFQFQEQYAWYAAIGSSLHLGVDGLSLTMVLLTTLLTPLALLASFSVSDRVKPYLMLFLFLETGMLGVFMAIDLLIFFVFWEIGLVPMYFLINQWGSANRNYASLKFMIYTMGGSLGLCSASNCLAFSSGVLIWPPSSQVGLPPRLIAWLPNCNCKGCGLLGFRHCLCRQSPDLAVPYLAS